MQSGYYVRCPLRIEAQDAEYPRCFMLAQIEDYNEIADSYVVTPHDLLGTAKYYLTDVPNRVFAAKDIDRCAGAIGGRIECEVGMGTIVAHTDPEEDEPYKYYVKLDSGEYIIVDELHAKLEYSQMDYSPLKQLMNYELQHPTWYANRIHVSRNVNFMNNASYGFKTMAGCRAFLLPHQVSTVARCFEFYPIRYMLADEVGLGKTIEACSIVKIMSNDNSNLKALFIVPAALVNQWKTELTYKFAFSKELANKQFEIVALEDYENRCKVIAAKSWDVLVIDETHRLLANESLYGKLLQQSINTENVLLLSATPIQDRKDEYHKLLSLLLPEQYLNMPEDRFEQLVKKQKRIQRSVNIILRRMPDFEDYEEDIFDKLSEIEESLEDDRISKMLDTAKSSASKINLVENMLSYICENYRLERRVIRNRRSAIVTEMPKRELEELSYAAANSDDFYDETEAIEAVMRFLSEYQDPDNEFIKGIVQPLLSSVFSSPWAFTETIKKLGINDAELIDISAKWEMQAKQELEQIDTILEEEPDKICSRMLRLIDYLEQETDLLGDEYKIVVFTSFTGTLKAYEQALNHRLNKEGFSAVSFSSEMDRDELETSVYEFQNNDDCRIIICDETGGEGRNFQNANIVVHIDLPWTANALEQRIGRLDRLGRDPETAVVSLAIHTENTTEEQLFKIWKDGMQLFNNSLSGLEIITGELNEMIAEALSGDYYNGLGNALDDIMDVMEDMIEAVQDEQQYDVGATIYRPLNKAIEEMLNTYLSGENEVFSKSMLSWCAQAGLTPDNSCRNLTLFREDLFSPRAALQSLFAPPDWSSYEGTPIMRRQGSILGTFSRKKAIEREDLLFFAPNDAAYEAIATNAMSCGRGRCCAVAVTDTEIKYSGFIFTFTVQPDVIYLIDKGVSPRVLSQFRVFLPSMPLTVLVPLTAGSRNVPETAIMDILNQPWRIKSGFHWGKRSGKVQLSNLERFILRFPEEMWQGLVKQGYGAAKNKAKAMMEDVANIKEARREINRIIAGRKAELAYFNKNADQIEQEIEMYREARAAISNPKLVLDSICFFEVIPNE